MALALSRSILRHGMQRRITAPRLTRAGSSSAIDYLSDLRSLQDHQYAPDDDEAYEMLETEFDEDDTTSIGHHVIQGERDRLYYMRLIEHDMPKLVAFRKPFESPRESTPLIVRSLYYGGENHPVEQKRCVVVAVDNLPLNGPKALHRIKLLAGPRWSPEPPTNGGVSGLDIWNNGYIKIACEDFPTPAMNFKWASDTLDALVSAANDPANAKFDDVPIDSRHVDSRARQKKKGQHRYSGRRPSILDFPKEWLPSPDEVAERQRQRTIAKST